jgi:hypothetical protein
MDQETSTTADSADAAGPSSAGSAPKHRSVADGELLTTWSLSEFFSSLNTVMRLPARVRRKKAEEAAKAKALGLPSLDKIRVPNGLVAASVLMVLGVFVIRPLVLSASGSEDVRTFTRAFGVWQAKTGKYAGRMFEVGEFNIAFRTSSDSPDYTWHKIEDVRISGVSDSTLYTVVYEEEGKTAEFAFWLVQHKEPIIRFLHQPEIVWEKTPYEPIARPKS